MLHWHMVLCHKIATHLVGWQSSRSGPASRAYGDLGTVKPEYDDPSDTQCSCWRPETSICSRVARRLSNIVFIPLRKERGPFNVATLKLGLRQTKPGKRTLGKFSGDVDLHTLSSDSLQQIHSLHPAYQSGLDLQRKMACSFTAVQVPINTTRRIHWHEPRCRWLIWGIKKSDVAWRIQTLGHHFGMLASPPFKIWHFWEID